MLAEFVLEDPQSFVERGYEEVDDAIANGLLLRIRISGGGEGCTASDIAGEGEEASYFVEFANIKQLAI